MSWPRRHPCGGHVSSGSIVATASAPTSARSLRGSRGADADCGLHRRHLKDGACAGLVVRGWWEALDFATVSDAPRAQDVLLRRRGDTEEVHVSALLAPLRFEGEEPLPRDALMKVFVSKPGVEPLLRFDCRAVAAAGGAAAGYDITALSYHAFPGDGGDRKYEGPDFGDLDPKLQAALKEYLLARGVTPELATSLREHLLQKEQAQYRPVLLLIGDAGLGVLDHEMKA
uniref:Uncharacterized protein n=1 Tax=Aegilops tauschii TaxID=37682 RepID=M8CE52_AEGTA